MNNVTVKFVRIFHVYMRLFMSKEVFNFTADKALISDGNATAAPHFQSVGVMNRRSRWPFKVARISSNPSNHEKHHLIYHGVASFVS